MASAGPVTAGGPGGSGYGSLSGPGEVVVLEGPSLGAASASGAGPTASLRGWGAVGRPLGTGVTGVAHATVSQPEPAPSRPGPGGAGEANHDPNKIAVLKEWVFKVSAKGAHAGYSLRVSGWRGALLCFHRIAEPEGGPHVFFMLVSCPPGTRTLRLIS
jgi:hypothetical protein